MSDAPSASPSDSPIPGFITKTDVEERYGRSHRSLTRDFSRAVRVGDAGVLAHLKLRTEDGDVREGSAVSLDLIQELSNKGLTPTWYIEREWAARTYAKKHRRSQTPPPADAAEAGTIYVSPETDSAPKHVHLIPRLEQQIKDLKRDKEEMREELKIKNEQIRDGHKREQETNQLIRELHQLMAHMQERLLPAPTGSGAQRSLEPSTQGSSHSSVQNAEIVTASEEASARRPSTGAGERRGSKKPRSAPTPQSRKTKRTTKTNSSAKRSSRRAASRSTTRTKKATAKSKAREPSTSQPTFRERVSSFLHRKLW